ncbi:MAG: protein DA1 [Victivallaceae bacterium]|nr:protein DA1 [Victivallaceae bacterium]
MKRLLFNITALFCFTVAILLPTSLEAAMRCTECGKRISGRYIKANRKTYCSQNCYRKTLPKCAACGKTCTKYYTKNGKKYCSKKCLNTTLPKCVLCGKPVSKGVIFGHDRNKIYCSECAALPKCFSCMLPGDCTQLDDGRNICSQCAKTAIYQQQDAEKLLTSIRAKMGSSLNLTTHDNIKLHLTDSSELKSKSPDYSSGHELGLYLYKFTVHTVTNTKKNIWGRELSRETTTYKDNVSYSIYVLYGTPRHKLIEVLAHELGHDWMQKYYPKIKDLKIKEGWAEYVASQVNILYGRPAMNRRMKFNKDKTYGDGYRMISAIGKKRGMTGIKDFFRQNSR